MVLLIKICGLSTPDTLDVALESGADMVGFVFFPPSPRHISLEQARALGDRVQQRARKVANTVDANDAMLGEIVEALQDPLKSIVETGRRVLEKTPPELVADIIDRGVALCGGGALLRGIDKLLTKSLGIPAYLVDNPSTCVVEGAVKAIPMYNILRRSLPQV